MQKQVTIAKEVFYEGIGLHSGKPVSLVLKPAPENAGLLFIRTDIDARPVVHANAANVTATLRATTIEENGVKLFTIEHLMSAFQAKRVDNCIIEMNSEEPPVTDGSARVFCELIDEAGLLEQEAPRRETVIDRVYRIDDKGRFVMALPYDGLRVSFTSINPHPLIGLQYCDIEITPESYMQEIAGARTIAYEKEIEGLRRMGLGLGGTLENVIVYNDGGWLNSLRYPDELVRHKVLDLLGDLRLAGLVRGHIIAAASGHELNTRLAGEIFRALGK